MVTHMIGKSRNSVRVSARHPRHHTPIPDAQRDPPASEQSGEHSADAEGFHGFEEAREIMWRYEVRARVNQHVASTSFMDDGAVAAVHVDTTAHPDRAVLTAFDHDGARVGGDVVHLVEPQQRLDIAPEFDHDFTGMNVPEGSALGEAIARENGWVIDMRALRVYEPRHDRRRTQRAVFLAHLGDMMNSGQVRSFLSEREHGTRDAEGPAATATD
ncbi:hypothetical protein [Amycolatopsis sp. TNS106]|uniref:hypothetical protein n=1 Tax=Amycolatopsis sp. TNS106 TaxID=2861750 RepID=UPI001C5808C1|nr:hypothetical protein [Amycolatopsis sp. TNS106]